VKKVKNGVLYDTDTAQEICSCENDTHEIETLYRKRNNSFFIGITDSFEEDYFRVKQLTEEEAKIFVEDNATVSTYVYLFGEVSE